MKCIDAIEGTAKCILKRLHATHRQACSDDSEYVHQVKTVIDAAGEYVKSNPEMVQDPEILKQVLYVYSRNLWLMDRHSGKVPPPSKDDIGSLENDEYQTYYYDYLYDRGVYPS